MLVNLVIFSVKVSFGKRELLVQDQVLKNLQTGNFLRPPKRRVFTLTPVCPLSFNTCLAEILRDLRVLQRRGGILSRPYRLFWSSKYFTPSRTVMSTPDIKVFCLFFFN